MQHTTGRNSPVAFLEHGQENAFRQAVSAGIMAVVAGNGRKTRCCTGNGLVVAKDTEKQGVTMILNDFRLCEFSRKLCKLTYVDSA